MSHFGLTQAIPTISVTTSQKPKLFGLYKLTRRSFYEGGSDKSEWLLFVHESAEVIRQTMNKLWEHKDLFICSTQMKFELGAMKTNKWWTNGGGCGAEGDFEIRPMDEMSTYVDSQMAIVDKGVAWRAEQDRRNAEVIREGIERRAAQEALRVRQEKQKELNVKRRTNYAANKDEINSKRRARRALLKANKLRKEAENREKWDALTAEYHKFCLTETDETKQEDEWYQLWDKYYK